jgi:hypothetical protein
MSARHWAVGRYATTHGQLRGDDTEYQEGGPLAFVTHASTVWVRAPLTASGVVVATADDGRVAVVSAGAGGVGGRWLVLTPAASRLHDPPR